MLFLTHNNKFSHSWWYLNSHGSQVKTQMTGRGNVAPIFMKDRKEGPGNYDLSGSPLCQGRLWNRSSWKLFEGTWKTGLVIWGSQYSFTEGRPCLTNLAAFYDGVTAPVDRCTPRCSGCKITFREGWSMAQCLDGGQVQPLMSQYWDQSSLTSSSMTSRVMTEHHPMRTGWERWGSSAWRSEGSEETL